MQSQNLKTNKPAKCRACGLDLGFDWNALAKHIVKEKDQKHRRSKTWAAKFLMHVRRLNQKKDLPQRLPLTEQQKENKKEMAREVSGQYREVIAICPGCKGQYKTSIELEHFENKEAWLIKGKPIIYCERCRS